MNRGELNPDSNTGPGTRCSGSGRNRRFPPALWITERDKKSAGGRLMIIFPPPRLPLLHLQIQLSLWLLKLPVRISSLTRNPWQNRCFTGWCCLKWVSTGYPNYNSAAEIISLRVNVSLENCWHLTHILQRTNKTIQDSFFGLSDFPNKFHSLITSFCL